MKSGIEMMLDSMGIQTEAIKQLLDPENVKKLLQKVETLCNDAEQIKASVIRIETKLGTIPETVAMQLLESESSEAFKDATDFVRDYNGESRQNGVQAGESRQNGVQADGNSRNSDNGNGAGDDTGRDSGSGRGL